MIRSLVVGAVLLLLLWRQRQWLHSAAAGLTLLLLSLLVALFAAAFTVWRQKQR